MNNTASILKYMSKMDIEMLSLILDDSKTYQEASKEVFIEKLKDAFDKFKKENDNNLIPYPGICGSEECDNMGCKGYSFVGNISGSSLDLIFDEKNDEVHDIYYCHGFCAEKPQTEEYNSIIIDIGKDEEANYVPSPNYLYQAQLADKATEEILSYSNSCISKETITYLATKYESLYYAVPGKFSGVVRFNKFSDCYWSIRNFNIFISFEEEINSAFDDFSGTDMSIDSNLLNWLLTYEYLAFEMLNILNFDRLAEDSNYLIANNIFNFYVSCGEFKKEIEFAELYQKEYSAILRKYELDVEDDVLIYDDYIDIKRLLNFVNTKNLKETKKTDLLTESQICNWVPLRFLTQDSKTPGGIRLNQAHELFHQDNYEDALSLYKEILETRNDFYEAWIGLAASHYMLGNYDEALTVSYDLQKYWFQSFICNFSKQCELKIQWK